MTTQTNENTAAFNKALNLNNYTSPFGSQHSTQVGVDPSTGAPIYDATISANPGLQSAIGSLIGQAGNSGDINQYALNGINGMHGALGTIGAQAQGLGNNFQNYAQGVLGLSSQYGGLNNQYAALGSQLDQNAVKAAQQQGQDAAYKAQTQYLDPQFSQQGESLSASLANSGLTPGSEAYNNAMTNFNNQKQQAYSNAQNQAIMTGSQLGEQNLQNQISGINTQAGLLGARGGLLQDQAGLFGMAGQLNQGGLGALGTGLNALQQSAGLYGQQVGIGQTPYSNLSSLASLIPGFSGTGQASANPADVAGYMNNAYQGQLASHNADVSSANSTTGAIAGLAGMAAIAF